MAKKSPTAATPDQALPEELSPAASAAPAKAAAKSSKAAAKTELNEDQTAPAAKASPAKKATAPKASTAKKTTTSDGAEEPAPTPSEGEDADPAQDASPGTSATREGKAKPATKPTAKTTTKTSDKTSAKSPTAKPASSKKAEPASAAPTPAGKSSKSERAGASAFTTTTASPTKRPEPLGGSKAAKVGEAALKKASSLNRADLRSSILAKSKTKEKFRPTAFSLQEAREIARTAAAQVEAAATAATAIAARQHSGRSGKTIDESQLPKPTQPNRVRAASLADILGFNPRVSKQPTPEDDSAIPEKYRRYYKLLLDLRNHLTGQLDTHTEETLKRSSKDDAGDLSSYGQHMADAGTDTFDRDFALSVVSSEQEALTEVEAAIQRIKAGTYGICEMSQKPIARERLIAVPFTRYSAEAQKEIERNRHRSRAQAGLFGELGEEGGAMGGGDDGGGGDD